MLRSFLVLPVLAAVAVMAARAAEPGANGGDEDAVRQTMFAYIEAFNQGDADKAAAQWAEDGEYLTDSGEALKGRDAIHKGLKKLFAEDVPARVTIEEAAVRFASPEKALADGVAGVAVEGEPATKSAFSAVLVRKQGKWKLHDVRETAVESPPSHYEQLKSLEWMIGDWVDQNESISINSSCQWTKNKNFITRSFTAAIAGRVLLECTQVIGWDASSGTIRSWVFDSDGGFAEGNWSEDGKRWTVQSRHVLPDGGIGSSTNIMTFVDQNKFTWESIGREVDGEMLPNIKPVTIVRATADHQESKNAEAEQ